MQTMFDVGAAKNLLAFFGLMVGFVIIGLYLWTYACHCYAVVVEETAAGIDNVKWPDVPLIDWAGALLFYLWLLTAGVTPVWLVVVLAAPWLLESPLGSWPLICGVLWLVFPILLLSVLSAGHRLVIVHGGLLRRLVRRPLALLGFYFLTGIVLSGAIGFGLYGLTQTAWLPLAVPAGAAAFLVHARLLGRFAWLLGYRTPLTRAKKKKRPRPVRSAVEDPWAIPEDEGSQDRAAKPMPGKPSFLQSTSPATEEKERIRAKDPGLLAGGPPDSFRAGIPGADDAEDEWTPRKRPYGVLSEEEAAARQTAEKTPTQPPEEPSEMEEGAEPGNIPSAWAEDGLGPPSESPLPRPGRQEMRWLEHRRGPPPPRYLFFSGVFQFPWYPHVLKPWLYMSLAGLLWAFLLRGMLATWPF